MLLDINGSHVTEHILAAKGTDSWDSVQIGEVSMNDEGLQKLERMVDRRSFLLDSCFAAGGIAAAAAVSPVISFAQVPQPDRRRAGPAPSLSRQLARWVVGLRYEDLPPAVIDRAKGLTVQALASVL